MTFNIIYVTIAAGAKNMGVGIFESPIGLIKIITDGEAIVRILRINTREPEFADKITNKAKEQLAAYFCGELRTFDLPIRLSGEGFLRRVWESLSDIPYGETRTYGFIAASCGNPKAYRSAGNCVGRNPIPIILPCHRVVAANGLGGFGWGLDAKRFLLDLESKNIQFDKETHYFTNNRRANREIT